MVTPTLLDVATIRGLKPTGETFDPSKGKSSMTFDFIKAACGPYIRHHHNLMMKSFQMTNTYRFLPIGCPCTFFVQRLSKWQNIIGL